VISLLKSANQKYGRTILMITHSQEIARQADRIIRIEDGRIAEGQAPAPLQNEYSTN